MSHDTKSALIFANLSLSLSLSFSVSLSLILHMTLSTENVHPRHPPNREIQISQYLAVKIQIENLVEFEFVPRTLSFWIWWNSGK